MKIVKQDSYRLGISEELTNSDIIALIDLFKSGINGLKKGLSGRGDIVAIDFENGCRGIVKQYRRGGFVRHLVKEYYFKTGQSRCEAEYQILNEVGRLGGAVPEPIAWATTGNLFYKGWLVMKEIENSSSLADYCHENPDKRYDMLEKTVVQIRLLIEKKVLHVDLHPGNVLVSNNQVYIIDFDKAEIKAWDTEKLKAFYLQRWRRAVLKHGLDMGMLKYLTANL